MKRIVVLYGGKSGEHEVSRVSAASVVRNLDPLLFEVLLVGIRRSGEWLLQPSALVDEARKGLSPLPIVEGPSVLAAPSAGLYSLDSRGAAALACDLVFPVLHGTLGEDGTVQGLLEMADLPYIGAPVLGSALGMDKEKAKIIWSQSGLSVLPWICARKRELLTGRIDDLAKKVDRELGWPCFVKPVCAGSSVGASKALDFPALKAALGSALEWDERALIEPFCSAREIECSVLGNAGAEDEASPMAFVPGEVVPSHEFYDYEAKYLDPEGARLEIPARVSAELSTRIRETAIKAYEALELAGMSRVDFFLDKADGSLYLNEVNTIPGFTSISMYPKMCEAGGLPYGKLLESLARLALSRHEARASLRFNG